MNVFEYAKQMELDGIHFYQEELKNSKHPGFKRIFKLLINQEQKHYNFFESLRQNLEPEKIEPFPAEDVENIFRQMWKNNYGFDFSAEQASAYEKALSIEKESEEFYRREAEKTENENLREQILMIADEERKHTITMNELVEYMKRPEQWVEHAMFSEAKAEY